jgi:hypothetical protein
MLSMLGVLDPAAFAPDGGIVEVRLGRESFTVSIGEDVQVARGNAPGATGAVIDTDAATLDALMAGEVEVDAAVDAGRVRLEGDTNACRALLAALWRSDVSAQAHPCSHGKPCATTQRTVQMLRPETAPAMRLVHRNGRKLLLTEPARAFLRTSAPCSKRANGCTGDGDAGMRRTGRTDLPGRQQRRHPAVAAALARTAPRRGDDTAVGDRAAVPRSAPA